nr:MAG TPA_asm: hypothetical protein [Caudoviricetes sp.]
MFLSIIISLVLLYLFIFFIKYQLFLSIFLLIS